MKTNKLMGMVQMKKDGTEVYKIGCLGKITRPVSSDDLLGEIFSEFCIGK